MSELSEILPRPFCESFLRRKPEDIRKICKGLQAATDTLHDGVVLAEGTIAKEQQDPRFANIRPGSVVELATRLYAAAYAILIQRYDEYRRDNDAIVPPARRCQQCPLRNVLEGTVKISEVAAAQETPAIEAGPAGNGVLET